MKIIIIGCGRVGARLAQTLSLKGCSVMAVDKDPTAFDRLGKSYQGRTILGVGFDRDVLIEAGIERADGLAAVTGEDENNLVVTNLARFEFNVPRVIGRVNNPKNAWLYTPEMGVDAALNQADLLSRMIAEEMSLGDMMVLLKLRKGQFSLIEEKVHPSSRAAGRIIQELNLTARDASCTLVAILRKGNLIMPEPTTQLQPADEILAVVKADHLAELKAIFDPGEPSV